MIELASKFILILVLFLTLTAGAQEEESYPPFEELTEMPDPFSMRDPFFQETAGLPTEESLPTPEENRKEEESLIKNLKSIADLRVVGIMTGLAKNKALVEIEKKPVIIEEGMQVGKRGGRVIAIREKGLVYTESQMNIYRKFEVVEKILKVDKTGKQSVSSKIRDVEKAEEGTVEGSQ